MSDLEAGMHIMERIHELSDLLRHHDVRICTLEEKHAPAEAAHHEEAALESVAEIAAEIAVEAAEEAVEAAQEAEEAAEEAEEVQPASEPLPEPEPEAEPEAEPEPESFDTPQELIEETPPDRHHPLNKRFSLTSS